MKKKILALCLVVVLAITAVTGATLAYFTDTDKAANTFTVGKVDIKLTEPNWDEEEKADVYAGEALAKDPTVTNIGENPCFVRIKITGWDSLTPASEITYRTDYVDGKLGDGWVLHTDGYFYYTKPLVVDGTEDNEWNEGLVSETDALFDQIVIPTDLTNDVNNKTYTLDVIAYAVQAQGAKASWSAVKEMEVAEIAEWFETVFEAENIVP